MISSNFYYLFLKINLIIAYIIYGFSFNISQIEGSAHEDGKGPSIWDTFTEKYPGFTLIQI